MTGILACMSYRIWILVAIAVFGPVARAAAEYPQNLLSARLGARVFTPCRCAAGTDPNSLRSDGPVSKGRFALAASAQERFFIVDLGRAAVFDRIEMGTSDASVTLRIEASADDPDGPFTLLLECREPAVFQTFHVPLTTGRYIRFVLGPGERNTAIHNMRIYKGYEHPRMPDVARLLYGRLKPDIPELAGFRERGDANDWAEACVELRGYYRQRHKPEASLNPDFDTSRAQAVIAGRIDHAGLARTDPPPIDWSYMLTTDWYEHRNFLNRGAATGMLADAAYYTNDPCWAGRFAEVMYDWIDANPKPDVMSGPDYPTWRTLDTAARLGWLVSRFPQVTAAQHVDDALWANYLYSIWEHADYLRKDDFSGGNWLATITSAVTHTALEFPEFADRRIWLEYGKTGFERNVLRDVHPDGKEMEDAPGYICMAYGAMLSTLESLQQEGIAVDPEALRRLDKVQDFLMAVTQPNGIMPNIGDWGGCEPYALPAAVKVFNRDDVRYCLTMGKEGVSPATASVHFPYGGWTILRSPYTTRPWQDAYHLVFKSSAGSHGHRDVLSITAYALGRELLIDPGIRSYEREDVERYLRTDYHNTVCIDRTDQPHTPGRTDLWFANDAIDCIAATFTGYPGLAHQRIVLFVKPGYWLVSDRIAGSGRHTYDQNWHFAADAAPSGDGKTGRIRTHYPDGANLLIVPADPQAAACEPFEFFIAARRMASTQDNIPAVGYRYHLSGEPPVVFDTLLYPWSGADVPSVSIARMEPDAAATALAVKVTTPTHTDYVFVSQTGPARVSFAAEGLAVDAEILLLRTQDGKPVRLDGRNIRRVTLAGQLLYDQARSASGSCFAQPAAS